MSRTIRWDALEAPSDRDREVRSLVAKAWWWRAKQEHLAVGAFSMVARELADVGCDSVVLALVTKAASDEVRHADICARLSWALDGTPPRAIRFRGSSDIPMHEKTSPELRVLLHVVEMSCLSETLTGAYLTEMLERAEHPTVREAIASLLEDEIDHGRLGWAYLAERAAEGALDGLEAALPELVARTMSHGLDYQGSEDPACEAFGYVRRSATIEVFESTYRDAIRPGFAEVGVNCPSTPPRRR